MRKAIFLTFAAMVLIILNSCSFSKSEFYHEITPFDQPLIEIASGQYSDDQLRIIEKLSGNISKMDKKYPIECMKEFGDEYAVYYWGKDSILIIYFDSSFNKIYSRIEQLVLTKADFDTLSIGDPLSKVQELDPNRFYSFMYSGRLEPMTSEHYTTDGYYFQFKYDSDDRITDILVMEV